MLAFISIAFGVISTPAPLSYVRPASPDAVVIRANGLDSSDININTDEEIASVCLLQVSKTVASHAGSSNDPLSHSVWSQEGLLEKTKSTDSFAAAKGTARTLAHRWRAAHKATESSHSPPFRSEQGTEKEFTSHTLTTLICLGFLLFASLGLWDWYRFSLLPGVGGASAFLEAAGVDGERAKKAECQVAKELPEWSMLGLIALVSYRFYTGFLSATWLPYLLAMEGADLYSNKQSSFMGLAKLIYGLTILANPLFGLIGDRAAALSHIIARRLFLRAGIVLAGLGLCICFLADFNHNLYCFVLGILLWRIGEALNDVTTEALVPELVPPSQYAFASAAKASSTLLGGLSAYVLLIFMKGYHYTWLYWVYAGGMLLFAIPVQVILCKDSPTRQRTECRTEPFMKLLQKAYIAPAVMEGWFPQICLAILLFSLGTSPMFFLLLMIRDLVGTSDAVQLQDHFSTSSIIFFLSAATATVVVGLRDKMMNSANGSHSPREASSKSLLKDPTILVNRIESVAKVAFIYAVTCLLIPTVALLKSHSSRIWLFYLMATVLGSTLGSGMAHFQDATWQLIPAAADVANAMGFNIMCRLFGVGMGNFIAGMVLEFFPLPEQRLAPHHWFHWYHRVEPGLRVHAQWSPVYHPAGYVFLCVLCSCVSLVSGWLCLRIAAGVTRDANGTPVPAA